MGSEGRLEDDSLRSSSSSEYIETSVLRVVDEIAEQVDELIDDLHDRSTPSATFEPSGLLQFVPLAVEDGVSGILGCGTSDDCGG
jgi:hypothetical protein